MVYRNQCILVSLIFDERLVDCLRDIILYLQAKQTIDCDRIHTESRCCIVVGIDTIGTALTSQHRHPPIQEYAAFCPCRCCSCKQCPAPPLRCRSAGTGLSSCNERKVRRLFHQPFPQSEHGSSQLTQQQRIVPYSYVQYYMISSSCSHDVNATRISACEIQRGKITSVPSVQRCLSSICKVDRAATPSSLSKLAKHRYTLGTLVISRDNFLLR